jgi:AraC-like DNA-binding protein
MLQEKIIYGERNLFHSKIFRNKYFNTCWHFHPEYEIVYVYEGKGKRFLADKVDFFKEGDLVLFGPNIPHLYLSNEEYYKDNDLKSCWHVLHFTDKVFPHDFQGTGEFQNIEKMLEKSAFGLCFKPSPQVNKAVEILKELGTSSGFQKIISLYVILDLLGQDSNSTALLSYDSHNVTTEPNSDIINLVYKYLTNNFHRNIKLIEIANYVNFTPNTLCTYFKRSTQSTIFDCLANIRISYACKLLVNSDLTITQIAYDSGYGNISHFNKQFLMQTSLTPTVYRDSYKKTKHKE